MCVTYDIEVAPHNDPYVSLVEPVLQAVKSASTPGCTFDMLPFCGYADNINDPALVSIIALQASSLVVFKWQLPRPQRWRLILTIWSTNHIRPLTV